MPRSPKRCAHSPFALLPFLQELLSLAALPDKARTKPATSPPNCSPSRAPSSTGSPRCAELPDGAWKMHTGDLAHGEAANLDESGWQAIVQG